jgi:lauroyl/myristoyl acyltransferase
MHRLQQTRHTENIACIVSENLSRVIIDRLRFGLMLLPFRLLRHRILRLAPVEGIEKLDNSLSDGRGAIIYSCHIGPYFLIPATLALSGYRTVAVEKLGPFETPVVNRQVRQLNRCQRHTVLETETAYDDLLLRKLARHLREGKVVFIMGDYHGDRTHSKSIHTKFMGHNIVPGRAIAWLHAQTGAPVFPLVVRYRDNQGRLALLDELRLDKGRDVPYVTQTVYQTIERTILEHPAKWVLWMDYHLMLAKDQDGNSEC